MSHIVVCALYKFVTLDNYTELKAPLLDFMLEHEVRGTLLLAQEGINAQLSVPEKNFEAFKEALDTTENIIKSGTKVVGLFLDPVNSFDNGWSETGNVHEDEKKASKKILKFSKNICSVFLSQHPTMAGQRQAEDVNSYNAEGGNYLNKAHFTWAINRDNGSSVNRISVDNVRNTYTGGGVTHPDNPLLLHYYDIFL